jgi:hypothetical protein
MLRHVYNKKSEFLICVDINIVYLNENNKKRQIKPLLTTYNLSHTINFATRTPNISSRAIDNVFMDSTRLNSS